MHAVAEIDRDGDGAPLVGESLVADGEEVGHARERRGDGVQVDADHVVGELRQRSVERYGRRLGGGEIPANGVEEEGAGAAGGIQHPLPQRIGDDGVDEVLREPVGRVVLAHPLARFRSDH